MGLVHSMIDPPVFLVYKHAGASYPDLLGCVLSVPFLLGQECYLLALSP
jgi:hypothetical protein